MSDQRLTKQSALTTEQENALICERLLKWKQSANNIPKGIDASCKWHRPIRIGSIDSYVHEATPSFTDWASAGLILEALATANQKPRLLWLSEERGWAAEFEPMSTRFWVDKSGPLAIRAAALEYTRSMKA